MAEIWQIPFYQDGNFILATYWLWQESPWGPTHLNRNYSSRDDFIKEAGEKGIEWGYVQCYDQYTNLRFTFYFTNPELAMRFKLMDFNQSYKTNG